MPPQLQIPVGASLVLIGITVLWHMVYRFSLSSDVRRQNAANPAPETRPPGDMKNAWKQLNASYGSGGLGARIFSLIKRTFMPYRTICTLLSGIKGPVVDVGCGEGLLIHILSIHNPGVPMVGIDIDGARLENGRRAASIGGRDLTFVESGADAYDFSGAGTVMSTEAIHHMPIAMQDQVFQNIYTGLQPGGSFLLFEVDKAPTLSWLMCEAIDWILYREWSNFRSRAQWISLMEKLGFIVTIYPITTSFGILIIFLARKPG